MVRRKQNITVNNSNSVIIGDSNTQGKFKRENEFFEVDVDNDTNGYVKLFRYICEKWGSKNFLKFTFVGFVISGIVFMYVLHLLSASNGSLDFLGPNTIYYLLISVIVPAGFLSIMYLLKSRTCEQCGKPFAYNEYRRKSTSERKRGDSTFYTLKSYLQCVYCGHKTERKENVERKNNTESSGKIF